MDVKALALGLLRSKTAWGGVGQWLLAAVLAALASGQPLGVWIGTDRATAQGFRLELPALLFAAATAFFGLVLWGRKAARGPLGEDRAQGVVEKFARDLNTAVRAEPCSVLGPFSDLSPAVLDAVSAKSPQQSPSDLARQKEVIISASGLPSEYFQVSGRPSPAVSADQFNISARTSPAFGGVVRDWAGQAPAGAPAPQAAPYLSPDTKPEGGSHA